MLLTLLVALIGVFVAVIYNRLINDRNRVNAAWSDIDVQLQRRHDLVPRLVEAVKGYAGYEKATLQAITTLRAEAVELAGRGALDELGRKEQQLDAGVRRLIAVAESYPDLKASENFLGLQEELADTEDHLQFARRFYNGSVRQFNTRVESVPGNIVAALFRFRTRDYYQKESDDVGNAPRVDLGADS